MQDEHPGPQRIEVLRRVPVEVPLADPAVVLQRQAREVAVAVEPAAGDDVARLVPEQQPERPECAVEGPLP